MGANRPIRDIYNELQLHLLRDTAPSDYINQLATEPEFKQYPFRMLLKLKETEQSPKYHPEGSVWNHTMLVVDEAAQVREICKEPVVFMWAALLHDIGKSDTTRNRKGKITSYEHDMAGALLAEEFLKAFHEEEYIARVSALVKYHMHMLYILKNLPYGNPEGMLTETDPEELALFCRCDRMGRLCVNREEEEKNYQDFLTEIGKKSKKYAAGFR